MKIVAKKRIPSGIPKSYTAQKQPNISELNGGENDLNNFIRNDTGEDEIPRFSNAALG